MGVSAARVGSGTCGAITLALLTLACTTTPLAAEEIYKSVDAQGHVVYSDRGAVKNAPKTSLHVAEPDPAEVARLAHEDELLKADEQARNHYYYLKDSARIYQRDADGGRSYLSDEAADAAREQARRAMVTACGS